MSFPLQVLYFTIEDREGQLICTRFPVSDKMLENTDRVAVSVKQLFGEKDDYYVIVSHEDGMGWHLIDVKDDLVKFSLRRA